MFLVQQLFQYDFYCLLAEISFIESKKNGTIEYHLQILISSKIQAENEVFIWKFCFSN